ncbi:MAG TPA: nuclear transport factor 2 family protein [Candidatus Competibacter sp.]|nr:hypothetical protein [Candidatus Competibacteraceae bacterium]HRE55910.1 nuclear transport factor 2 family protein [Candidatus Competibacter sp.]HUM96148.1 nuclear transport factor 2 family protein [Candidatus Competibacter sp.]
MHPSIQLSLTPALLLAASTALAGPAADNAQSHFRAIAGGQVESVLAHYTDSAALEWVGGPLDGRYAGKPALNGVWNTFAKAQGQLAFKVSDLRESANPKGATVTANVVFSGKNTIKVRYVLTYRDGKIASEVWQIDPNLAG